MKFKPAPSTYNGQRIEPDEFAFIQVSTNDVSGIVFHCRGNPSRPRLCSIPIRRGEPLTGTFGWDGNMQEPTITPSIGCDQRCGWHGHLIKGEITP